MRPEQRHQAILELLSTRGRVEVDELVEALGSSPMTIRRDLALLEAGGSLRRVYRGAEPQLSGSYEPPFALRAGRNADGKRRMAQVVRTLVRPGQTVIVDGGTTGVAVAEALCDLAVTVCTHSLRVAGVLLGSPTVRLMITGGIVRQGEHTLVGLAATRMFEDFRFDAFLMSASGAHPRYGLTEWNPEDAEVKRAALRAAERCIVTCDASKLGHTAFARVADWEQVDDLVVDEALPPDLRAAIEASGVEVHVAGE